MFSQEEKKLASAPSILKQIEETMNLLESKYGFSGTAKFDMYKDSQFSNVEKDISYGKWIALKELRYRVQHPRLIATRPLV
jgi:hypothetical protein